MLYDGATFERGGRKFKVEFPYDADYGPPWEIDCAYEGLVTGWVSGRDGYPGTRVLFQDRGSYRLFNVREAHERAKKDGWGLGPDQLAALTRKLGRTPTKGEIRAAAVERAFDYLYGWANDQWHYCGVVVALLDEDDTTTNEEEAVWGIEDNADAYLEQTAYELAAEINARLDREAAEAAYWAERDVRTEA